MSDSYDTPSSTAQYAEPHAATETAEPAMNPHAVAASGVALSASSPSTTTTAPVTSVGVTVPGVTGTITFSLVVTDNLGVQSAPAYATVTVQAPPVAVLTATPSTVTEGGAIALSGAASTSSGSITSYDFSYVPATVLKNPVPVLNNPVEPAPIGT